MKWEYRCEREANWSGLDVVNRLGVKGWECFKVFPQYIRGPGDSVSMWFKRPIE